MEVLTKSTQQKETADFIKVSFFFLTLAHLFTKSVRLPACLSVPSFVCLYIHAGMYQFSVLYSLDTYMLVYFQNIRSFAMISIYIFFFRKFKLN